MKSCQRGSGCTPSISSHSKPCTKSPTRNLKCFVYKHSVFKTKYLRLGFIVPNSITYLLKWSYLGMLCLLLGWRDKKVQCKSPILSIFHTISAQWSFQAIWANFSLLHLLKDFFFINLYVQWKYSLFYSIQFSSVLLIVFGHLISVHCAADLVLYYKEQLMICLVYGWLIRFTNTAQCTVFNWS